MVKPEDFLAHATKLLASAGTEIEHRNVTERAYYGAYHAARQFEEQFPFKSQHIPQKVGSHEALIQRLEHPNAKLDYPLKTTSLYVGAQLRMLKPLRELATYKLHESVTVRDAEDTIALAKDVLEECAAIAKPRRNA